MKNDYQHKIPVQQLLALGMPIDRISADVANHILRLQDIVTKLSAHDKEFLKGCVLAPISLRSVAESYNLISLLNLNLIKLLNGGVRVPATIVPTDLGKVVVMLLSASTDNLITIEELEYLYTALGVERSSCSNPDKEYYDKLILDAVKLGPLDIEILTDLYKTPAGDCDISVSVGNCTCLLENKLVTVSVTRTAKTYTCTLRGERVLKVHAAYVELTNSTKVDEHDSVSANPLTDYYNPEDELQVKGTLETIVYRDTVTKDDEKELKYWYLFVFSGNCQETGKYVVANSIAGYLTEGVTPMRIIENKGYAKISPDSVLTNAVLLAHMSKEDFNTTA